MVDRRRGRSRSTAAGRRASRPSRSASTVTRRVRSRSPRGVRRRARGRRRGRRGRSRREVAAVRRHAAARRGRRPRRACLGLHAARGRAHPRRAWSTSSPRAADAAGARRPAAHDRPPPSPQPAAGPAPAAAGAGARRRRRSWIPVVYDGEDLDEVGELHRPRRRGVVEAHTGQTWTVAFAGFAPGFGYLVGERRPAARASPGAPAHPGARRRGRAGRRVQRGLPARSPGGWQLIGRTDPPMWDLGRDPPALLRPGVRSGSWWQGERRPRGARRPARWRRVQDLGRPGTRRVRRVRLGRGRPRRRCDWPTGWSATPRARPARGDARRARRAGRRRHRVAMTGARCAGHVDGTGRSATTRRAARGGRRARPRCRPPAGLRTYLAVRGGIDVAPVLGLAVHRPARPGSARRSCAPGDRLPIGPARARGPAVDLAPRPRPPAGGAVLRDAVRSRDDWFTRRARRTLVDGGLDGHAARAIGSGCASTDPRSRGPARASCRPRAWRPAALQVPPSGAPMLFLADHPVTGGYPVIAVVVDADLDAAGQVRPGQAVRFRALPSPSLTP